ETRTALRSNGRAVARGPPASEARDLEPARESAEPIGCELLGFGERVRRRGPNEILERLDVLGVDRVLLYAHRLALLRPGHDDHNGASAGRPLDRRGRQLILRLGHVGLHLLGELLDVAKILHSISMMRPGRPMVSWRARSMGSSLACAPGCFTHLTRMPAFKISERSCSSWSRPLSGQSARAKSSPNPITIIVPSIAIGSAVASCAALPTLRSFARVTSSPHALRTSSSATTGARAPAAAGSGAERRSAMETTAPRGGSRRAGSERVADAAGLADGPGGSRLGASGGGTAFSCVVARSRIASSSGSGVPSVVRRNCSASTRRFAIFASWSSERL